MGYWDECVTHLEPSGNDVISSLNVPVITANYDHSEPFGYIMMSIATLLMLTYNGMFFHAFLLKRRQPGIWAFLMWGNLVYIFQVILIFNSNVNRLQLVLGVLHNLYELYITYWMYMTIRGYIRGPTEIELLSNVKLCDRVVVWTFTVLSATLILGQLIVIILFNNLRYGIYGFYLIFASDFSFLGSSFVCFGVLFYRRITGIARLELFAIMMVVIGHTAYAVNSLFICHHPIPTAVIALITNMVSTIGVTWLIFIVTRTRGDDQEYLECIPENTFFCA